MGSRFKTLSEFWKWLWPKIYFNSCDFYLPKPRYILPHQKSPFSDEADPGAEDLENGNGDGDPTSDDEDEFNDGEDDDGDGDNGGDADADDGEP